MALERSSTTISCIESYLANPNLGQEAANIVIQAVLAIVCYNVSETSFTFLKMNAVYYMLTLHGAKKRSRC
jgi:hypothetical protein